ncbi:DUF5681 domain-containing protein [Methylobacterium oxalidis]|uniref:DUF5681 domain-containing protein n=1 Tax=Methylobacterium oxalidis TaxID=944322 RepID=UPI0033163171
MSRSRRKSPSVVSDYTVGFGRPPQGSRFKPGQSGNPRGRPKAQKSTAQMLSEALFMPVAVTENGQRRRMPAQALLFRTLMRDALRGDKHAIRSLLMLMKAFPEAGPELRSAEEDHGARVREMLDRMAQNMAIEQGRSEPVP